MKAAQGFFDEASYRAVRYHWDTIAKPLDGLGLFENTTALIGGIQHTDRPSVRKRTLIVFLSDNGIVEEGVSQSDSSVTHSVAEAMSRNCATVCMMAGRAGTDVYPVDIGMKGSPVEGISYCRIRNGTRNFRKESAMTESETLAAMGHGYRILKNLAGGGNDAVLLGEMGIGNTSTATAVGCALLGEDPLELTGRGAGLSDEKLTHKARVIRDALSAGRCDCSDPLDVLQNFGGYDIAGMTGAILAGADLHVPVILDGLITLSAALLAERLVPGSRRVCIPSHIPTEKMGQRILRELELKAPIDAGLALGEGTGAVLLMPLLDVCMELYDRGARFEDIGVEAYTRFR